MTLNTGNAGHACGHDGLLQPESEESMSLKVLVVTTEFPTPDRSSDGIFISRQIAALRAAKIKVDVLPFRSACNPFNHLRAWRRMRRMLAQTRYDVIHAHFGHAAPISRMQLETPVVATYWGSDVMGIVGRGGRYTLKGLLLSLISRSMALLVDEVIVVNTQMGKKLPTSRYHVVPSAVDLELFRPIPRDEARRKLQWPLDRRIVLFVALNPRRPVKRLSLARAAVKRVAGQLPVELCQATGVAPDDIPLYMNASDALLLTSKHEGSPHVVSEALSCNLPVVSVDVGDVRERLEGVRNCHVVEATPRALAGALVEVLREPARSSGREAVKALSQPLQAEKVISIYKQALKNRAATRAKRGIS